MRFTIPLKEFREAFHQAAAVSPSKTPKEILKFVRCTTTENGIALIGTSGEISVEKRLRLPVDKQGEMLLPVDTLKAWLNKVPDGDITIDGDEKNVMFQSGRSKANVPTCDPQDFPPIDQFEATGDIHVEAGWLANALRWTVFATDVESARYALGGVLINGKEVVATDSRRLSLVTIGMDVHGNIGSPIVPSAAVRAALAPIAELGTEDSVSIRCCNNRAAFECGDTVITARLVEGRFPKYQDVIPKSAKATIRINTGELSDAVRQMEAFTDAETRGVDFKFADGLYLSAIASSRGSANTSLPIDYQGEPITATFDPRYIYEMLRHVPAEESVDWHITDSESPSVLKYGSWQYVVMPLSRDKA